MMKPIARTVTALAGMSDGLLPHARPKWQPATVARPRKMTVAG